LRREVSDATDGERDRATHAKVIEIANRPANKSGEVVAGTELAILARQNDRLHVDVPCYMATTVRAVPTLHDLSSRVEVCVDGIPTKLCALRLEATEPGARRRFLLLHGNPSHIDHFAASSTTPLA
jgi:hypothetical protein